MEKNIFTFPVNPVVLCLSVLYWHHSSNKTFVLLTILITLVLLLHLLDLYNRQSKNWNCVTLHQKLDIFKLINITMFGGYQSKCIAIKCNLLVEFLLVILTCAFLVTVMLLNVNLTLALMTCFVFPILLIFSLGQFYEFFEMNN